MIYNTLYIIYKMQAQNEEGNAIWSNNSKTGFTLLKSDGTKLIINKGCWE